MKQTNILFMCRANCFRSKIAEAYLKKINKNKNIKIKSAAPISGYVIDKVEAKIAKEFGVNIKGKPTGISADLLKWVDLLIIVADDVPSILFAYEKRKKFLNKIIRWDIKDVKTSQDITGIKRAVKEVMKKVEQLNKKLNKK